MTQFLFNSRDEVIKVLSQLPKGASRRQLLDETNAVNFITSIGSNVTLYCGKPTDGNTFQDQLKSVLLILIQRCRNGMPDGLGAFGGLSECMDSNVFESLSQEERSKATMNWDNVIIKNNQAMLISDISEISKRNVQRETREEFANIGIYSLNLPWDNLTLLPFKPQDDSYLVNRWEKGERVSIVKPQCYKMEIPETTANYLVAKSNQGIREANTELLGVQKLPLTEALFRINNSPTTDYHYPHEWLASWFVASSLVKGEEVCNQLANALQSIPQFESLCAKMQLDPKIVLHSVKQPKQPPQHGTHKIKEPFLRSPFPPHEGWER